MNVRDVPEEDLIFILGSPRSGTTWLAKIFDSHPDVLYRHEPDKIVRAPLMQQNFMVKDYNVWVKPARDYTINLINASYIRTIGIFPINRKSYYLSYCYYVRALWLLFLSAFGKLGAAPFVENLRVPDFVSPTWDGTLKVVIKSIVSHRRAGLMAEAMPGCKIVYIIRDPLAQVASMRRGIRLGKFEKKIPLEECLAIETAANYGLTPETFSALPLIEQLAWHWALHNEKALNDLGGKAQVTVVRYADLCADPLGQSKALFAFAGLSWRRQTEAFVRASTSSTRPESYYRIYKNTAAGLVDTWPGELSPDEQSRILRIVRKTTLTTYCENTPSGASEPSPKERSQALEPVGCATGANA
jgi:hypothetical protein